MNLEKFKNILKFAIENEMEAQKFYEDAAGKLEDQNLKDIFIELAGEEKSHRETLKQIYMSNSIKHYFEASRDYKVSETVKKPEVSANMKPADAIALAMKNEEEAMRQYNEMADGCQDPETKKILLKLAAMEQNHKFKLENAFVDIGYPEVW